jgi:hypothetical protein
MCHFFTRGPDKTMTDKSEAPRYFRLRFPSDLKKWLSIAAAELDTTQQDLAIAIIRRFAENPTNTSTLAVERRSTKAKFF